MTKREFLDQLYRELADLPAEERQAAMEYYEECFDDVGPAGEQGLIDQLGSPKKVASIIKANLPKEPTRQNTQQGQYTPPRNAANGQVVQRSAQQTGGQGQSGAEYTPPPQGKKQKRKRILLAFLATVLVLMLIQGGVKLVFDYQVHEVFMPTRSEDYTSMLQSALQSGQVERIQLEAKQGEVEISQGDNVSMIYEGKALRPVNIKLENGALVIKMGRSNSNQLELVLPREISNLNLEMDVGNLTLEQLDVEHLYASVDMGSLKMRDVNCGRLDTEVDMGNLEMSNLNAAELQMEVAMGDIEAQAEVSRSVYIDVDMGDATLVMSEPENYGWNVENDFGSVSLYGMGINGMTAPQQGGVYFDISCDMGSVEVIAPR